MLDTDPFSEASDGALSSYNSWAEDTYSTSGDARIDTGRLRTNVANATNVAYFNANVTPASADYMSRVVMSVDTAANANGRVLATARMQTSGRSGITGYGFGWTGSLWRIFKWLDGVETIVTASFQQKTGPTLADSTDYAIEIRVEGSTITGFVDGVAVARHIDTSITTAGKPGLAISNSSTASTGRAYISVFQYEDIDGDGTYDVYQFPSTAEFYFSPFVWDYTNNHATCINPGNKVAFTTDSENLQIIFDIAGMDLRDYLTANRPVVKLVIDDRDTGAIDLTSTDRVTATLGTGTHRIELRYESIDDGSGVTSTSYADRANALIIRCIGVDPGADVTAYVPASKSMVCIGDSITRGLIIYAATLVSNAFQSASMIFADGNGYEASNYSFSGFGVAQYLGTSVGMKCLDAIPNYSSGRSRVTGSYFTDQPDAFLINLGTNDEIFGNTFTGNRMLEVLQYIRAKAPNALIIVVIPFGGFMRTGITNAFNTFADANSIKIDLGDFGEKGTTDYTVDGNIYARDGLHPNIWSHARYAARMSRDFTKAMAKVHVRISY